MNKELNSYITLRFGIDVNLTDGFPPYPVASCPVCGRRMKRADFVREYDATRNKPLGEWDIWVCHKCLVTAKSESDEYHREKPAICP